MHSVERVEGARVHPGESPQTAFWEAWIVIGRTSCLSSSRWPSEIYSSKLVAEQGFFFCVQSQLAAASCFCPRLNFLLLSVRFVSNSSGAIFVLLCFVVFLFVFCRIARPSRPPGGTLPGSFSVTGWWVTARACRWGTDIRNVGTVRRWRSDEIIWACREWLTVRFRFVKAVKVPLSKLGWGEKKNK